MTFRVLVITRLNTLKIHLESLKIELLGSQGLVSKIKTDAQFIRLLTTIQFFISENNIEHCVLRREVFKCISIIEKLQKKYGLERSG